MFTGIVEAMGEIVEAKPENGNVSLSIRSSISRDLAAGQSVSHDGCCLSVTDVDGDVHRVTAIAETLDRTKAGGYKPGDRVNLERSMTMNSRLDGHLVQGHVDTVAVCERKTVLDGSTVFLFRHPRSDDFITVPKGSVCVDGISLTVVEAGPDFFSVAIIPHTLQHTNLGGLEKGGKVNVEFDIVGKYLKRLYESAS